MHQSLALKCLLRITRARKIIVLTSNMATTNWILPCIITMLTRMIIHLKVFKSTITPRMATAQFTDNIFKAIISRSQTNKKPLGVICLHFIRITHSKTKWETVRFSNHNRTDILGNNQTKLRKLRHFNVRVLSQTTHNITWTSKIKPNKMDNDFFNPYS